MQGKGFDKIQQPFRIKTSTKLGTADYARLNQGHIRRAHDQPTEG